MTPADLIGVGRDLGARLNLVGVLPGATLALYVLLLVWSGAPGDAPDVGRIPDHAAALGTFEAGLLTVTLLVAAVVSAPLQLTLVRALEGYWGGSPPARALAARMTARHERRRADLAALSAPRAQEQPDDEERRAMEGAAGALSRRYPPAGRLLPTALGNTLRAAEARAGQRYGLETVTAWPRLYPLLGDGVRAVVDAQRDQLDVAARFCAVFAVAAATTAVLLATHGAWPALALAPLALALLSYRGAIEAALGYGEAIHAAFDLHRFDLLAALHLPLPADRESERDANGRLTAFLLQGAPENLVYEHPDAGDR